jgi:hypothetical protein
LHLLNRGFSSGIPWGFKVTWCSITNNLSVADSLNDLVECGGTPAEHVEQGRQTRMSAENSEGLLKEIKGLIRQLVDMLE